MSEVYEDTSHLQVGVSLRDEQYGQFAVRSAHWRYMAFGLLLVLVGALWGWQQAASRPARIPVYILVDRLHGDMRVVGETDTPPEKPVVRNRLTNFVETIRGISTDKELMVRDWRRAFMATTPEGNKKLQQYFDQHKPLEATEPVKVEVHRVLKQTDQTFDVRWTETTYTANRTFKGQQQYSGLFTLQRRAPVSDEEFTWAPEGLFFHDWSWSKE